MATRTRTAFCFIAAALLALAGAPQPAAAQSLDNAGTDFLMMFLPNPLGQNVDQVQVHLASDTATMVTVEYPANAPSFSTTVPVTPGTVSVVGIPQAAAVWPANTIQNNLVHATADDEFVAYMVNKGRATTDAALALPVDTMNTEYIVQTFTAQFVGGEFGVYAAFDNTTVTITPSNNLMGRPAGVPFNVVLNAGEGFYSQSLTSSPILGDLSGSIVSADRPVGVTNGNGCTQVPSGTTACDHIFEVAQPVQSWGNSALVSNLPNRPSGSVYRIMASEDGTTVEQDGVFLGMIDRADFIDTGVIAGDHQFAADKPIFVTQYMTGDSYPGANLGDPAMGNMVPSAQYLGSYTFSTVGGSQFVQNFLSLIANDADVGTLELDGTPIPAASFNAIGATGFSAAIVALTDGPHTTSSDHPHGITVEGYNDFDSYIYPGGALFQFINPMGDPFPPVCTITQNGIVLGSATDDTPSEDVNMNGVLDTGEDTNNNGVIDADTGIFFLELLDGGVNMDLSVVPFVPGDPMVSFSLAASDPNFLSAATVRATDGAGNTCTENVQIGDFDTNGEINRPTPLRVRIRTPRPDDDTEGIRCVEAPDPGNPDFDSIPFTPFVNDEAEVEIDVSTEGDVVVCCQFIDTLENLSAPVCQEVASAGAGDICDVDGNQQVDRVDIGLIFAARGQPASGPDDPRDANHDGVITVNDARECVMACDLPRCATN